jgi:hypothetical protein
MDSWIIILGVVPFLIGMGGQVARNIVLGEKVSKTSLRGWKRIYSVTLPLHAISVGSAVGLVGHKFGLPVPEMFGIEVGGSTLAYALSGGVAIIGYDSIVKTLKRIIEAYKGPVKSEESQQNSSENF